MSGSKKKRVPKPVRIPVLFRHPKSVETDMSIVCYTELDKFREGLATEESWHTLLARMQWAGMLASVLQLEVYQEFLDSVDALLSIKNRYTAHNKWGISAKEFASISSCLLLADELQAQATRKEQLVALAALEKVYANSTNK